MIQPVNANILVKLKGRYKHLETETEEKFGSSKTRGIVVALPKDNFDLGWCEENGVKLGSMIYFGKYEDTAPYPIDGEDHILIKIEDVKGVDND